MKRRNTMLLLLLFFFTAQAVVNYQSVVHEGWRWIGMAKIWNPYTDTTTKKHFYAIEARGDSVVEGKTYKKFFSYILFGDPFPYEKPYTLNPKNVPIALLRDEAGVIDDYGITGENDVKHYTLYDFSNREEEVKLSGVGPYSRTGTTKVGDYDAYEYEVPGGKVVEGVGYVSAGFGDLLQFGLIFRTSSSEIQPRWGLCLLEDSTGKVLYKGPNYDAYIAEMQSIADISGDGRVDVADINAAVSAVMGVGDKAKADVNGDGSIDIADINAVINVILNK